MSKHTKVTNMHGQGIVVVDALTGRTVADDERIVACVNAMAGIDDPAAFVAAARAVMACEWTGQITTRALKTLQATGR